MSRNMNAYDKSTRLIDVDGIAYGSLTAARFALRHRDNVAGVMINSTFEFVPMTGHES
jgi:pimeloyl-ACP methyl ester carboxylesterase